MFVKCSDRTSNELYRLLIGAIVPRPIAWVSTVSPDGVNNLAPFSFFNCFGVDPPMVGFAPAFKSIVETEGGISRIPKDTMRNIQATGEFVVNIVSRSLAEQMNKTSAEFGATISEFEAVGLTEADSELVAPRRVGESLVNLECKLIDLIQHGNNNLVLGEIVAIHLDDSILSEKGYIDQAALQAVGRLAGNWYCTTEDRFELVRPRVG